MMRQTSLSSIRNNPLQRMAHRDQGQRGGARRQRQAATEGKPPRFRVSPSSGFASVRSAVSVGVLSILLLSASAAAQRVRDQRELLPGVPIERALGGGETHAYRIRLAAGQYLRVVVDQRGMDLVVSLIGPDGRQLAETNGFLEGNRGEEFVSLVAEASGNYRVEVQTLEKTAKPGRYEVRIEELREATPRDRTDVAAERAFAEGDRLYPEKPRMALEKYQRALSLFRAAGDRRGEATALSGIGEAYFLLDEKRKAIEVDRQALRLWRVLGDRRGEAGALIGLAVQYWMLGEYQKALDYDAEALEIQRVMGDRYGEANTIHNMALVYWFLGEHQQALDFYNQALVVFRDTGSRVWEAATLNHIGLVYQEMGDYQKALDSYKQALAVKPAIGSRAIETEALFYIGNVYASLGEYRKALENFRRVLPIFRTEGSRNFESQALASMGKAHASLGEYQKALEYYGQALALARATGVRRNEWIYLYHIARVERDRGHLTEALARAEAALDVIESVRSKVGNRPLRASFFAQKQSLFEFYIDVLMRLHQQIPGGGYPAAALRAAERARARNLLDLLAEAGVDIRQSVDPALLGRERHLQEQVNAKERERMKLLSGKHTEEQAAAVDKELTAALTNYQEVERQIRAQSPGYAALTRPRPLGLKQIQQQVLDEDTLLLEYALGKERSFLWAVTPTSIKSYELPERGKIETAARRVYDLLTARNKWVKFETSEEKRARVARAEAEYPKAAAALSRMLLGPVVEQLGQKRLLVVTEGALQYVPLAALPKPRRQVVDSRSSTVDSRHRPAETRVHGLRSAVQPLIVDHEVVSLPSASVLAVLRRELKGRRPAGKSVAVLADAVFAANDPRVRGTPGKQRKKPGESAGRSAGPPRREEALTRSARAVGITGFTRLIYTRREAEAIAAMAGEKPHLRALDFAASRATVMRADLGQYRVLHFATHGLLNSLHPELSGIVLSLVDERGEPQDGFLRLNEIYNLKLGADLVVLSGCQTALGKEVRGEGLVGLTRGFMYAGAARVMASLWKVADASTAELMKRFYRGMLGEGLRPAEALRSAQVSMWRQRRWQSPYYWAAFVLQGEWR